MAKRKKSDAENKITTVFAKDPSLEEGRLKRIGGSASDDWNNVVATQVVKSLWLANSDDDYRDRQLSAVMAALIGIEPKDEAEGMIVAQMLAAHNAAMECYRRAMIGEQSFEGRRENLNQANKLSRTTATLLEALNRHRGKGQQKVTVEHVHVHQGGQAIVGSVETRGGGGDKETRDQPHALEYAPGTPMPSPNTQRETVSVASDEERAVPDARRHITRRTKR